MIDIYSCHLQRGRGGCWAGAAESGRGAGRRPGGGYGQVTTATQHHSHRRGAQPQGQHKQLNETVSLKSEKNLFFISEKNLSIWTLFGKNPHKDEWGLWDWKMSLIQGMILFETLLNFVPRCKVMTDRQGLLKVVCPICACDSGDWGAAQRRRQFWAALP